MSKLLSCFFTFLFIFFILSIPESLKSLIIPVDCTYKFLGSLDFLTHFISVGSPWAQANICSTRKMSMYFKQKYDLNFS